MITIKLHDMPKGIYGFTAADSRTGEYYTLVDSKMCPLQQRHTFGHELAHIFEGHFHNDAIFHNNDVFFLRVDTIEHEAEQKAWHYYRMYRDAFRQLQTTGKTKIEERGL